MIRNTKKIIAGFLAGIIVMASLGPITVLAEENDSTVTAVTEESNSNAIENENEQTEIMKEPETQTESEKRDVEEEQYTEETPKDEESEENVVTNEPYSQLEYFYVESPYLQTPKEQNLVLSWGDGTESIEKFEVLYQHNGQEGSFEFEDKGEGLFLYQKEFEAEEAGTYALTDIKLIEMGQEYTYNLAEMGIYACFGVNEYYPGYEPDAAEEINEIADGVAVISEAEVENSEAEEIVGKALEAVGAEQGSGAEIAAYSLDNKRSSDGKIVVALDAGHCSKHAGAYGNGVHEEEATLKIAQYCKAELEQYSGIEVYMCRNSAACPYPNTTSTGDIRERVRASVNEGADIYVSIHLNSSEFSSANGAEVWYPDGSQTPNTVGPGKELAIKIQNELKSIGLSNRGAKETDDNFACMDEGAKYNLPAVIVEHAFLSNVSDANTYLKTEAGLKKLGIADATGIANYFGLTKGYWITEGNNTYYYKNSQKVYGGQRIDGSWYYFDEKTGALYKGWRKDGKETYYYGEDGKLCFGSKKIQGNWYYFDENSGYMHAGWRIDGQNRYYYDIDGELCFGSKKVDGNWYYFNEDSGYMHMGWRADGQNRYYYDTEGELCFGSKKVDGNWYYFNEDSGYMHMGWRADGQNRYYYETEGELCFGSKKVDGTWYYFNEDSGYMHTGWRIDGQNRYYYDTEGELCFGSKKVDGTWYYFNEDSGYMHTGWRIDGQNRYYYDTGGELCFGSKKIDGTWYYFNENSGYMHTGWRMDGQNRYYYDTEGELYFGTKKIDGNWYYFSENSGYMHTGWRDEGSNRYYYDLQSGMLQFGTQDIEGKKYFFDDNGIMVRNQWIGDEYYGENGAQIEQKDLYLIMGRSTVNVDQLMNFYLQYSPIPYPADELRSGGAPTLREFCRIFFEEAEAEGVKVEVAFCQAMLETGWLKYGGDVKIGQYNFAGLGATGNGEPGEVFPNVSVGVRAQIQHLKAYGSDRPLDGICVDRRFKYVTRKCAPYVEWLGVNENPQHLGWAVGKNYGYNIMGLIKCLRIIR